MDPATLAPRRGLRAMLRRGPHDAEILRLAIPAFGALVAEPLFLLVDSAIVGRIGTVPPVSYTHLTLPTIYSV